MIAEIASDIRFRLRALFRRGAVERELDDELQFHLAQETEKYIRAGDSPDEARRKARAAFGGVERIKDDTRERIRLPVAKRGGGCRKQLVAAMATVEARE